MNLPSRFNVRVYGLLVLDDQILLSDEHVRGVSFTKFPGGGLEFGEGPEDCLKRELQEEAGIQVDITHHVYTTGFYQQSAFDPNDQVLSIYYRIAVSAEQAERIAGLPTFASLDDPKQVFRWMALDELREEDVTFPIDRHVVNLIRTHQNLVV